MEKQLLEEMILDRDKRIEQLSETLEQQELDVTKLQTQLQQVRSESLAYHSEHDKEIEILVQDENEVQSQFENRESSLRQVGSLRAYRECLSTEIPSGRVATEILKTQCQLCKALHYLHIWRNVMVFMKTKGDEHIESLKQVIAKLYQEKSKVELHLMNQLVLMDDAKKRLQEDYTVVLNACKVSCLEIKQSKNEESDDDEEESEEDKEESSDEESVLDAEERRKIFEKRKQELMREHLMGFQQMTTRV